MRPAASPVRPRRGHCCAEGQASLSPVPTPATLEVHCGLAPSPEERALLGWVPPAPRSGRHVLTPSLRLQIAGPFQRGLFQLGIHDGALLGRKARGGVDLGNPRHAVPGPQPGEARSVALGTVRLCLSALLFPPELSFNYSVSGHSFSLFL